MDTNVFISQLKPDDPYYSEALVIARKLRKGEIRAETSTLTILETASVAGRMYYYYHYHQQQHQQHQHVRSSKGNADERKAFVAKTLKMLAGLGIRFVQMSGDAPFTLGPAQMHVPSIFNESILLSLHTSLKTLDLMHVAAARHAKQNNGEIGAFVTGDNEILQMKEQLSVIAGMPFLSPREYVRGLGLK